MYKRFYKKSNLFFILALLICNISIVSAQNDTQTHINNCIYATTTPYTFEASTGQALDLRHATSSNLVIGCLDVGLSQQGRGSTQNMRLTLTLEAMYSGVSCPQISGRAIVPSGRSKQYTSIDDTYYLYGDPYTTANVTFTATPRAQIYDQCYYMYNIKSHINTPNVYVVFDTSNWGVFKKSDNYSNKLDVGSLNGVSCCYNVNIYKVRDDTYQMPVMAMGEYYNNIPSKYWESDDFNLNRYSSDTSSASSVIFFPGMLGSQMYDADKNTYPPKPDQVWPSYRSETQQKMKILNANNMYIYSQYTAVNDTISNEIDIHSTQDSGITRNIGGLDIYDSFIQSLQKLKSDSIISDYASISYDFRLATSDIYCNGYTDYSTYDKVYYDTRYDRSNISGYNKCEWSYVKGVLKKLINSSRTGKITLIGHSYGGIVIKEILQRLEADKDPLLSYIDKVILVAVPQAGSPEAIAALIHGEDIGPLGFPIRAATERELNLTFPSGYQLLPSDALILGLASTTPLITFTNKISEVATNSPADYSRSIAKYGNTIDSSTELYSYILAKDDRVYATTSSDLSRPSRGSESLMDHAIAEKYKLDSYVPTSTISVTQIAGWGIPTIIGYKYDFVKNCHRYEEVRGASGTYAGRCVDYVYDPILRVTLSRDGDDTVPAASALAMDTSTHPNVKSLWVDLDGYNQQISKKLSLDKVHKNILSVPDLISQVSNIIKNNNTFSKYIKSTTPTFVENKSSKYLTYSLHSPVHLSVTDSNGNVAGYSTSADIVNNMPNAYYKVIGETQILSVPADTDHTVTLDGYTDGVYSLDVTRQDDDRTVSDIHFTSIPTTAVSRGTIHYTNSNTATNTVQLLLDINGNGLTDHIIVSTSTATYTTSSSVKENAKTKTIPQDPIDDGPIYIEEPKIIDIPIQTPISTGTFIKIIKIKR